MRDWLDLAWWHALTVWHVAKAFAAETWESIPGPWPAKILVCVLLVACLAIPGPFDEMLVLALIKLARKRREKRAVVAAYGYQARYGNGQITRADS